MAIEDEEEFILAKKPHKLFMLNILKGMNATEAYSQAFPKAKRSTAATHGWILKKKYEGLLSRHILINSTQLERLANETLANLVLMAFADVGDIVDELGKARALKDIPKPLRMTITEIEMDNNKVKYKMTGKLKALELLTKIVRLSNDAPQTEINIISDEERKQKIKEIIYNATNRETKKNE